MSFSKRLQILEALAKASEATAEAMRLLFEDDPDSVPPPPAEVPKAPKPGKGVAATLVDTLSRSLNEPSEVTPLPIPRPLHRTRQMYAFTSERAMAEVVKALGVAKTREQKRAVLDMARRLKDQGLLTQEDIDELIRRS